MLPLRPVALASVALAALAAPALAHPGHGAPLFHTHLEHIVLAAAAVLLLALAVRAVLRLVRAGPRA